MKDSKKIAGTNFKDIPGKYRSIPFWSWNEKLDTEETARIIGMKDIVCRKWEFNIEFDNLLSGLIKLIGNNKQKVQDNK